MAAETRSREPRKTETPSYARRGVETINLRENGHIASRRMCTQTGIQEDDIHILGAEATN